MSDLLRNKTVQLSHGDLASFVLPRSVLVATKNEGEPECT